MDLTIVYRETAAPALRRLRDSDRVAFARVRSAISALADNPYPDGAVPWGHSGYYRLHAGDLRVLYEVDEKAQAIYILSVGQST
ncbi:MAG: type II toxin-antitoxin system RelE family toxin [Streptosporangiaceae bacterium]